MILRRPDVVEGPRSAADLLAGAILVEIRRHGKQLALIGDAGRVLVVQLGMTGRLVWRSAAGRHSGPTPHEHVRWRFEGGGTVAFIDPRRFGGLTPLPAADALRERWRALGPDALGIGPPALARGLHGSRRAVKAALLDQRVLAGVGNIYADEALFQAGIHPSRQAGSLRHEEIPRLAAAIRSVLRRAVRAGGSTVRDYVNADGAAGEFSRSHAVYGRGGAPCRRCGETLAVLRLAQRATVACPVCQPENPMIHSFVHTGRSRRAASVGRPR